MAADRTGWKGDPSADSVTVGHAGDGAMPIFAIAVALSAASFPTSDAMPATSGPPALTSPSTAAEEYVVHPRWTHLPSTQDLQSLYPRHVHGITAQVRAVCVVDDKGGLDNCDVISESPSGHGFGASTIKLSKFFQMRLTDGDGEPVAGRKLALPVGWYASLNP